MITDMIQGIVDGATNLIGLLPTSPFYRLHAFVLSNEIMAWMSWFIPFAEIIALLQAWTAAILVWYVAKKTLRWARLIQ